ncbi:MAG: hypothetical protein IJY81_08210, partial [Lachnospiraceae bacterium]|nr:hypothetical protein [Lachnospiraceae bacterium]
NGYGYYVYEVTKSTSTKLDFIFNNGVESQTADLSISASRLAEEEDGVVEAWVKPSGEISYTAPARSGGPTVNGNDVTFTYTNANAASVAVAGTMNDWSTTANVMTKNGSTFTYTMDLEPGVYEYKFVVSGDSSLDNPWISDPSNNAPTMSGGNSIFVVEGLAPATIAAKKADTISLPANLMYYTTSGETAKAVTYVSNTEGVTVSGNIATIANSFAGNQINLTATTQDSDTAKVVVNLYEQQPVTVKVHYDRTDGNESAWNAWIWADNLGGESCELVLEGGEYVATYRVPANKVLYTNSINFIMRKGNWLAQEGTRSIDLSNVVAGTVHSYVKADGSYSNDYSNAIQGAKIKSVKYNRSDNTIIVAASGVLAVSDDSFTIQDLFYKDIEITSVSQEGNTYIITLGEDLTSLEKTLSSYKLSYDGNEYIVTVPNLYDTEEFEEAYTYTGDDLGATYTPEMTTFKIWAPTAVRVNLMIYDHGSSAEDEYGKQPQPWANGVRGDNGVWTIEIT